MSEPIAKNIRTQRIAQGMTQEELATKVFTTRQTISNYENGKSQPDYEMIGKIAAALGVNAEMLLYDVGNRRKKIQLWIIAVGSAFLFAIVRSVRFSSLIIHCEPPVYLTCYQAYDMLITPIACCVLGWFLIRFCELYIHKREFHFNRPNVLFVFLMVVLAIWLIVATIELPKLFSAASDAVKNQYGGPSMLGNYMETFYYKFWQVWDQLPVLNGIFVLLGSLLAVCLNGQRR